MYTTGGMGGRAISTTKTKHALSNELRYDVTFAPSIRMGCLESQGEWINKACRRRIFAAPF